MKKITVYCGQTVFGKCGAEMHPVNEVTYALSLIRSQQNHIFYSNSYTFVFAIKNLGKVYDIETDFFLDGKSCGNEIRQIYVDYCRGLDIVTKIFDEEMKHKNGKV